MIIDGTDDTCNKYLKNITSSYYNKIKKVDKLTYIDHGNDNNKKYDKLNHALSLNKECYVFTNERPNWVLSREDKEFGKYLCEPVEEIKKEVDKKIGELPANYGIQHYRFDDSVFKTDITQNNPVFQTFFDILKKSYKNTDILMTNSMNFKKYAKEKLNIKTIDCGNDLCEVAHIGQAAKGEDSVKNSFIEFYVITKAKYINTHSTYDWVSNFVVWPSNIYDIPLNNIWVDPITGKIR